LSYREVWAADFEFVPQTGERPDPVCLVAWELRSRRKLKLWRDQLPPSPPYSIDPGALFIAFYASAELGCHRVLGWPMPTPPPPPDRSGRPVYSVFRERRARVPPGAWLAYAYAHPRSFLRVSRSHQWP